MCGIVGIIAKAPIGFYQPQISSFKEMLFADQVRGSDGTGIFYNLAKKIHTLKSPVPSSEFLRDPVVVKAMNSVIKDCHFIIGHNRAATKGALTYENTHPHRSQHIILIHNGTLRTHRELADVESDSAAICKSIATIGAAATIEKINGAFALVWYNTMEKSLNIIRNTERPLHLITTDNCYVISSEPKLAEWVLDRNKVDVRDVRTCVSGTLYKYSLHNFSFEETVMTLKSWSNYQTTSRRGGHYAGNVSAYDFGDNFNGFFGTDISDVDDTLTERAKWMIPQQPLTPIPPIITGVVHQFNKNPIEKIGSMCHCTPDKIITCDNNKEFYIEGRTEEGVEARVYSDSKKHLEVLSANAVIVGEVKATGWIKEKRVLFLKDARASYIKSLGKGSEKEVYHGSH